ncbi:zinc finger protein 830 [Cimex lectularius]|uniref:Zinc finger protein 830 n=1 Tax=Cimex lectularius TaxID=79782 RepID=A0A8I6S078_CIMLE|nr:zinc finger protein 830 [Cimex lectularius]
MLKFRMSRKKISQTELRKFMTAQKRKALDSIKKIESPLAKYSDTGVLSCIVCDSVIKSEAIWNVHINSKQHKENIARKKQNAAAPPPQNIIPTLLMPSPQAGPVRHIFKKPGTVVKEEVEDDPPPPKKLKGILKNATPLPDNFFDDIAETKKEVEEELDTNGVKEETEDEPMETETTEEPVVELPEGFFDNPILDAKARKVEYKDPIQEEWERFQREIKEETTLSAQIIHDETEDATALRQIEEIDEQLRKLSKVVELEKRKDRFKADALLKPKEVKEENVSSGEDDDYELEFDWRAKRYLC